MSEKQAKRFSADDFRKELVKVMPGYDWTVHRQSKFVPEVLKATGIQSSGFNRLSTLSVLRRETDGRKTYTVKSSGYGTRAPWLAAVEDVTLRSALRGLQDHYEWNANRYRSHAAALQSARIAQESSQ